MPNVLTEVKGIKTFKSKFFGEIHGLSINCVAWFLAPDVAVVLGYDDYRVAAYDHVLKKDKLVVTCNWPDGRRTDDMIISEHGVDALIYNSSVESAQGFKNWLYRVVVPELYGHPTPCVIDAQQKTSTIDTKSAADLILACPESRLPYIAAILNKDGYNLPTTSISQSNQQLLAQQSDDIRQLACDAIRAAHNYGYSLKQLAKRLGITHRMLSRYTIAKSLPSADHAQYIVRAVLQIIAPNYCDKPLSECSAALKQINS